MKSPRNQQGKSKPTRSFALSHGPGAANNKALTWAVGQKLTLEVEQLSPEGRGMARDDFGRPVFIEGALPGESARVRITEVHSKYADGVVDQLLSISDDRVEPACPHYQACGGCATQHMASALQVAVKQPALEGQLKRLGNTVPSHWQDTLHRDAWHYRVRAHLALKWNNDEARLQLGYRERGGKDIVDIEVCPVLDARLAALLPGLRQLLEGYPDKKALGHIELSAGDDSVAVKLRLTRASEEVWTRQACDWAEAAGVQLWLQTGDETRSKCVSPASEAAALVYTLPEFDVRIAFTPDDFIQVNSQMNQAMVSQAMELLAPQEGERVLDLFAGLGNFSLAAARRGCHVVAVEGSEDMVNRANANAQAQEITNVQFVRADLMGDFSHQRWAKQGFDKIILDPPRAGAAEAIPHVVALKPKRVVYISCNPATLARDAALLRAAGYTMTTAGAMDMFPQTAHLEAIAVFEPEKKSARTAVAKGNSSRPKRSIWR